jgi:hypothetical protein
MSDDTAARQAISDLNESTVDGRAIKVTEARPKEERAPKPFSPFKDKGGYKKSSW